MVVVCILTREHKVSDCREGVPEVEYSTKETLNSVKEITVKLR